MPTPPRTPTILLLLAMLLAIAMAPPAHAQFGGDDPFGGAGQTAGPPGSAPNVVEVSAFANKTVASPGDQLAIAVVLDITPPWHVWPNKPEPVPGVDGLTQVPTEVRVTFVDGDEARAVLGPVQYPEMHEVFFDASFGAGTQIVPIKVYEGRAIAFVPVVIPADAPLGDLVFTLDVSSQACDESTCLQPDGSTIRLTLPIVSLEEAAAATGPNQQTLALFQGFDASILARVAAGEFVGLGGSSDWTFTDFGLNLSLSTDGMLGFGAMLLVAAIGGFLLNLTPCVLPVIPIKIMGLSKSAGDKKKTAMLGLIMSLGVVGFWIAIGAAISFIAGFNAISSLFQTGWFAIVVGLVIGIMGLGMFGLFTVKLPQAVYMVNPRHDTAHGSFLFGVMTAILSTPCTAPFMGSAAAWAATRDAGITMSVFAAIGAGMALPYLILSLNPAWVKKVPKTGPASELVKQVMGIFMLAVAVFFLGTGLAPFLSEPTSPPFQAYWWGVAALVGAAGLWLAVQTFRISKKIPPRVVFGAGGLLLAGAGFFAAAKVTDHGPVAWVYYTPEAMEQARADGKVIVVDFTAEWCLNCKTLEATVLHSDAIAGLLNSDSVVALKVDLTGDNPDGQALLRAYGQVAIPALAIEGPGLTQTGPVVFNAYTPGQVSDAIEAARGRVAAR
ncbi:MAG: thioredoxin family protein [Phycisphaerales bacterium]|nr:thioredoxin family protein [Phycisphaerales bacterium]